MQNKFACYQYKPYMHTGLPNFGSSETLAFCWPGLPVKKKWNKHFSDDLDHPRIPQRVMFKHLVNNGIKKSTGVEHYSGPRWTLLADCQLWMTTQKGI